MYDVCLNVWTGLQVLQYTEITPNFKGDSDGSFNFQKTLKTGVSYFFPVLTFIKQFCIKQLRYSNK